MNNAIGLIEVRGLAGAVDVSDVMLKAANVDLIGVERAKGFGWMTVKVEGDVGAVKAAVDAGKAQAVANNVYISDLVIPRPAKNLNEVFFNKEERLSGAEPVGESLAEANKTDETFLAAEAEKAEVEMQITESPVEKSADLTKKPQKLTPVKEAPKDKEPTLQKAAKTKASGDFTETEKPEKIKSGNIRRKTKKVNKKDNQEK